MNEFTKTIVEWYKENKRELPWRESADPYLIWISEIILQQTRVAQGYDYFLRFIKRFPDVRTLAAAEEDEVMKYWQGLGYYSRARFRINNRPTVFQTHKISDIIIFTIRMSGCHNLIGIIYFIAI